MDKQEIFNKAVKGLASQGFERSVNSDGNCMYRSPEGLKCAIGWCIPDDKYLKSFEGKEVFDPCIQTALGFESSEYDDKLFLVRLRGYPNCSNSSHDVKRRLLTFAEFYRLDIPEELK